MKNIYLSVTRSLITGYFILGCIFHAIGQDDYGPVDQIAPSLDGSSTVRQIAASVDMYTGKASIQIPFYIVQSKEIQIPITLNYRTGGIKVGEVASWTGVGWNLSAGGRITRIIRDLDDKEGWMKRVAFLGLEGNPYRKGVLSTVVNVYDRYGIDDDTEPDLFYFELPGRSGMFVFDNEGIPRTIPHQDIVIQREGFNVFIIIDENGVVYRFGESPSAREESQINARPWIPNDRKITYCSSWMLSSISHYGVTLARFEYEPHSQYTYPARGGYQKFRCQNNSHTYHTNDDNNARDVVITNPTYIKSIIWENKSIRFFSDGERTDIVGGRRLTKIAFYYDDNEINSFKLGYSAFWVKFPPGYQRKYSYPQLTEISQHYNDKSRKLYSFLYFETYSNGNEMAWYKSQRSDHWGYLNNPDENKGFKYAFLDYDKNVNIVSAHGGGNRDASFEYAKTGALHTIVNHMGGKKVFEYEPHKTGKPYPAKIIGGLRIKSISDYDGLSKIPLKTEYQYCRKNDPNTSSAEVFQERVYQMALTDKVRQPYYYNPILGKESSTFYDYFVPVLDYSRLMDYNGAYVVYPEVKEILPNGGFNIYKFTSFNDPGCSDSKAQVEFYETRYGYENTENFYDDPVDRVPKTTRFYKRGILKEHASYSADNELVAKTTYHYNLNTPPKATVVAKQYWGDENYKDNDHQRYALLYGKYNIISQPVILDSVVVEQSKYNTRTSTQYVYDKNFMLPRRIINRDASGNIHVSDKTYPFDYTVKNPTSGMAAAINQMQQNHVINVPIEEIDYLNGKIMGARLNTFRIDNETNQIVVAEESKSLRLEKPLEGGQFRKMSISSTGKMISDEHYELDSRAVSYDTERNLLTVTDGFTNISYVYDKDFRVIANVNHAQACESTYSGTKKQHVFRKTNIVKGTSYKTYINIPFPQTINLDVLCDLDKLFKLLVYPKRFAISITIKTGNSMWKFYKIVGFDEAATKEASQFKVYLPYAASYEFDYNIEYESVSDCIDNLVATCTYYTNPVADHSRNNQVFYTSFEESGLLLPNSKTGRKVHKGSYNVDLSKFMSGNYVVSYWTSPEGDNWFRITETLIIDNNQVSSYTAEGSGYIDELWIIPVDARINTCAYDTLGNKISESDQNGVTTYYEYDIFGRLTTTRNNNRELIMSYEYNFKSDHQ